MKNSIIQEYAALFSCHGFLVIIDRDILA